MKRRDLIRHLEHEIKQERSGRQHEHAAFR